MLNKADAECVLSYSRDGNECLYYEKNAVGANALIQYAYSRWESQEPITRSTMGDERNPLDPPF